MSARSWISMLVVLPLAFAACPPDRNDDDDSSGQQADDDAGPEAELLYSGTAWIDGASLIAVENLFVIADHGHGDILCQIQYTVSSDSTRSDCPDCEWAFACSISAAETVTESDVGCDGVGHGTSAVNSETRTYGYLDDGDYDVWMVEIEGEWQQAGDAAWDTGTGEVRYEWSAGMLSY